MTNEELLNAWDNGEKIKTVEMGGLGDGYEKHIHLIAMEMLRYMEKMPFDFTLFVRDKNRAKKLWNTYTEDMDDLLLNDSVLSGSSGAQWSAARSVACIFHKQGYEAGMAIAPEDRIIEISK